MNCDVESSTAEQKAAVRITSEVLDDEAPHRVGQRIGDQDLPVERLPPSEPDERAEQQEAE